MARTFLSILLLATFAASQDAPAPEREPGFLGVTAVPLDDETRAHFGLPGDLETGVVLVEIVEGSAAEKAGLRAGDVLVSFDGKPVGSFEELRERVVAHAAGDEVAYVARRGTGTIEGRLKLGTRPPGEAPAEMPPGIEIVPMPVPAPGDLQERIERVQKEIERLRERVQTERGRAALRHPTSLGGWIHREELAVKQAKERGDERKLSWHAARLSILREMHEAETRMPGRRLERIEEKLDLILELLKERR